MPDNKERSGCQDRKRIDVDQDYELQDWSKKLGVTKEQLKEAVRAVGDNAEKVRDHLRSSGGGGSGDKPSRG
ncbi:DUF3606 domain-containing protein [Aquabacterium humicola]|uniref:DUF3606 domain-containing protein n=1 Tax=Aquabacterium humicola TaxID=3237377 RepID=UPI00254280FE|nr:DUF3606 domain-containing protein [Rubrivivax pictus]